MRGRYAKTIFKLGDLTDPNADRLLFWDDSAGAAGLLTPGTGLTITGTTINASAADVKVGIDSGATAGYLGAASSDGVLRTGTSLSYTDGGDFVTLNTIQDIRTTDTPEFAGLGLGDSSPGTLLQLKGASAYITLQNSTDENGQDGAETRIIFEDHGNNALAQIQGHHEGTADDYKGGLALYTNSGSGLTAALRINEKFAVGIQADPEEWIAGLATLQLGGNAAFTGDAAQGASEGFHICQNAVFDGAWKYISTDETSRYEQVNGTHSFYCVVSGTAGASITWGTQTLFIGNGAAPLVGIGIAASLDGKLHIDQSSTSGAVPVLTLDQADVSEEFFKFVGESTTDNTQSLIDAANLGTAGAIIGWLRIYVEDVQATNPITDGNYFIPFYATPTT